MLLVGFNVDVPQSQLGLNLLASVPAIMFGLWLGLRIFDYLSEEWFKRLVLWLILASGVYLQF